LRRSEGLRSIDHADFYGFGSRPDHQFRPGPTIATFTNYFNLLMWRDATVPGI